MSSPRKLKLLIEGWRGVSHSYAVVNQFQCLELLRRPEVELRHREMPLYSSSWARVRGLFKEGEETALREIPDLQPGERPEAILRLDYPHRLDPVAGVRTAVFMTSEYLFVPPVNIAGQKPLAEAHRDSDVLIITCSEWARRGVLNSGADPARVFLVPLGIDPALFHPLEPAVRASLRARMGIDGFCFFNLSGMTGNKRIDLLLKAFAAVAARHPQARLFLKGADDLYGSRRFVEECLQQLTMAERQLVQPRLAYLGRTLPFTRVRDFFQALDAYVSPYAAEGFNLPALEAAACGLPIICTAGGSTDDFAAPGFALPIAATTQAEIHSGMLGTSLVPSLDSLVDRMMTVIEQPEFVARARLEGPRFVAAGFHWSQIVDRLLGVFAPARPAT